MNTLQICPPHLWDVATLPWEIQKKSFFQHYYSYTSDYLHQKKTNSNCCTAALAVYLLLFTASYYLHSPSTASGAEEECMYWYRHVEAYSSGLLRHWAEFQYNVVYYATDHCWKRLEACTNAEGGHSKHLLWHYLPDIPVATHHNQFFSEPLTTHNWLFSEFPAFERMQRTFSQMKKFCNSQVSAVTFLGGVGKWITVCFLLA